MSRSVLARWVGKVACAGMIVSLAACDNKSAKAPRAPAQTPAGADAFAFAAAKTAPRLEAMAKEAERPDTEAYDPVFDNPFLLASRNPLSTFSADVNTASYSNVRRFLSDMGRLPPPDGVRIAELVNYFDYDYPEPQGEDPVAIGLELAPCPWKPQHKLLRIALQAKRYDPRELPMRNLVFLIDVSGSMMDHNKLPLVKRSLHLLVEQLGPQDRVSIVTYAGEAGLRLPPTPGDRKQRILSVIDALKAGGSTAGANALGIAYDQAMTHFNPAAINRVILLTDGDFNVGPSSDGEVVRLIDEKRRSGVYLTVLGYGRGNLKDSKLEKLARFGNGHYAYIDSEPEARKVFVEQGGALVTVAKDVKLQVQFNPLKVQAYRLVGYENRLLRDEDFRDDTKDAGDIGSGHTVTALYEIVPAGVRFEAPEVDALRYQGEPEPTEAARSGEWLAVKMRYKEPDAGASKEFAVELPEGAETSRLSKDFRFAAAVAAFGMLLRDSPYKGEATWEGVLAEAGASVGPDPNGHRAEFTRLVKLAQQWAERERPPGSGAGGE